jgi:hypothetical protein
LAWLFFPRPVTGDPVRNATAVSLLVLLAIIIGAAALQLSLAGR